MRLLRHFVVSFLAFSLCMALAACSLFQVPTQEIQTFSDAWTEVQKTHDVLLAQYEKDAITLEASADSTPPRPSGNRYPPPLPDMHAPQGEAGSEHLSARRSAVEIISQYNAILIAIRDNQPLTQTKRLVNRLGSLLLTGLKAGVTAIGLPGGVLDPIVNTIRNATTRVEIMRALRAAKMSQKAYALLQETQGSPESQAAQQLAALPTGEVACSGSEQASCVSLLTFALDLMRIDANAFYAQHDLVVQQEQAVLTSRFAQLWRDLRNYLKERQAPSQGSDFEPAYIEAQSHFQAVYSAFDENTVSFPNHASGAAYDKAAADFVHNASETALAIDEKDAALGARLTAYREAVLQYRDTLLPQTANYFAAIEVALAQAPDLLGVSAEDADTILPIVEGLIDGSVDIRATLLSAVRFK